MLRQLIISGMSRQQLIDLIKRRGVFKNKTMDAYSIAQLRDLAIISDKKMTEERKKMKKKKISAE